MPALNGWADTNSIGNNINPFLRSLDGLNEHDLSFARTLSGGVTSGLMLPGSANSIGGQAFPIKLRPVRSNSPSDRLIDPPASLVLPGEGEHARTYAVETGMSRDDGSTSWRYMKVRSFHFNLPANLQVRNANIMFRCRWPVARIPDVSMTRVSLL